MGKIHKYQTIEWGKYKNIKQEYQTNQWENIKIPKKDIGTLRHVIIVASVFRVSYPQLH